MQYDICFLWSAICCLLSARGSVLSVIFDQLRCFLFWVVFRSMWYDVCVFWCLVYVTCVWYLLSVKCYLNNYWMLYVCCYVPCLCHVFWNVWSVILHTRPVIGYLLHVSCYLLVVVCVMISVCVVWYLIFEI